MNGDITQERIRAALEGLLGPLAKTLLRCGVSYSEFAELSKRAFVEAASREYGVRNRPTNMARVAVMTGLSRKEVSRIRRNKRRPNSSAQEMVTMPAAVLNQWYSNPRYQERSGEPKVIAFSGPGPTFCNLVRSVSRDIPPGAMRQELIRAGAIRRVDRTHLVPVKRHFIPDSVDERILVGLELGLRRLAETVAFNSEQDHELRFQRFVEGGKVPVNELAALKVRVHAMLVDASLRFDSVLSAELPSEDRSSNVDTVRVGVGLYYFEEPAS